MRSVVEGSFHAKKKSILQEHVQKEFQEFGEVSHIRYRSGNERGLVKFLHSQDALKAFKYFQENKFLGFKINVVFNSFTNNKNEAPQKVEEIRIKELDDIVAKDKEILAILKTSWNNFCSTVPQSQGNLTFDEISQCLDKIPYEMAQPWTHPSFLEEIQKISIEGEKTD